MKRHPKRWATQFSFWASKSTSYGGKLTKIVFYEWINEFADSLCMDADHDDDDDDDDHSENLLLSAGWTPHKKLIKLSFIKWRN